MVIPTSEPKILPLQQLNLPTRPITKRSIAFSPDGDLAVAGDNTVWVSVPEFPRWNDAMHDVDAPADEDVPQNHVNDKAQSSTNLDIERNQYSSSYRTIRVSEPPLDPRVNAELFAAAQLPVPWDDSLREGDESERDELDGEESLSELDGDAGGDDMHVVQDAHIVDHDSDEFGEHGDPEKNGPTGKPNTMNHFVNMAWSPSGLGLNGRPVLAVQTADGTVGIYGDGRKGNVTGQFNKSDLDSVPSRRLDYWARLWGFGGRLLIPGQEAREEVVSFAWSRDVGPRQALLAYLTGLGHVVVLSVQTVSDANTSFYGHAHGVATANGDANANKDSNGMVWHVWEVARFAAKGPHPPMGVLDPDWVPTDTSYGLAWGPWLLGQDGSLTCLLSFIDRNYVGFRKMMIRGGSAKGELLRVHVADADTDGLCVHLSTEAFVEFEDAVWTKDNAKTCRGYVATPHELEPFEVTVAGEPDYPHQPHPTEDCDTTYASEDEKPASTNPIMGLIIHPVNPIKPTPTPIYTLIRLSATANTSDWCETNHHLGSDPATSPSTKWAKTIQQFLEVTMTADMNMRRGFDADDNDSAESDTDDVDLDDVDDFDLDNDDLASAPQIHTNRFFLWGLAASPGAGVTAVIVSKHNTQLAWRPSWRLLRSMVLFSHWPRRGDSPPTPTGQKLAMSTEGRAFEWMYGGGPDVPGLTCPRSADAANEDDVKFAARRALFVPAVQTQRCPVCGSAMARRYRGTGRLMTVCDEGGHRFGTCGASGLAIRTPGTACMCGVCGTRTIRADELVALVPTERRAELMDVISVESCGRCRGKFLD